MNAACDFGGSGQGREVFKLVSFVRRSLAGAEEVYTSSTAFLLQP